jgi:hypothetical protein
MLDSTGNVMTWNSGAERIKQIMQKKLLGRTSPAFIRRKMLLPKSPNNLREALAEGIFEIKAHAFGKT